MREMHHQNSSIFTHTELFYYPPSVDLSNTTWAQRGLISKLRGYTCGGHGMKVIIKYYDKHSNTFGIVTRIRPK